MRTSVTARLLAWHHLLRFDHNLTQKKYTSVDPKYEIGIHRRVSLVACAGAAGRTSSLGFEYNWLPVPGLRVYWLPVLQLLA